MFTTITISIMWPNLAFSEGQKETPYTNTSSNYASNLIKWNSVNASGVSTLIVPAKSNSQTTISNSAMPSQKQHQEQNQLSTEHNTTTNSNNTAINEALHSKSNSNSNRISPSITNKSENDNENSNSNVTASGVRSNLTQTAPTYHHNYNNNNNNTKSISISIESSQNIVNGKGASTVRAVANDATTGKKIENATVKLNIAFTSNGTSKEIVGHSGEATYSVELKPNSNGNLSFKATAEASAPGYNSTSKTTTSSYSASTSTSSSTSNSTNQKSIINSSNTASFT
jgi:hypothetical protein